MKMKLVTFAVLFMSALIIKAAPGDLDPTFGNGGKVITTGIGATSIWGISDIAIQPDGKIVAVGGARIVRYNANGSLDSSFGTGGIVTIQLGDNIYLFDNSAAVQRDGKIVVTGSSYNPATGYGFAVIRYNPNGTPDTSFNGTGIIITPAGNASGSTSKVAIQTDGKIVVAGDARNTNEEQYSVVFRYNSTGTPDTSFNGTGSIITPNSSVDSVAIQPDGKIIVGGSTPNSLPGWNDVWISRYNADGLPDTSFGGAYFLPSISTAAVGGLAVQSDGKIVAKVTVWENGDFGDYIVTYISRLNPTGSHDIFVYEHGLPNAGDLAIQPDGKIVSVSASHTSLNGGDFLVRRYNPYGLTDTTFNEEGRVATDFGFADETGAVAIQADGKIVAAGVSYNGSNYDFALARYQGGSSPRTRFDFDGDGRADVSVFRPSDRIWYINQSTNGFAAAQFGLSADKLTPADYDGDGRTDISVYRDGMWYWLNSSDNSFHARQFGIATDIPVPANYYTGGGRSELAVYRNGTWWILNLVNEQVNTIQFGVATDKPVVGDYDGDGRADQAVYRNGEWYLNRSSQGFAAEYFGLATDKPVPADYDGDGLTDFAVFRPSDRNWYIRRSSDDVVSATNWGLGTDIPVPADYDGDGRADIGVYRNGIWYVLQSSNGGISYQHFGLASDIPVASANSQ